MLFRAPHLLIAGDDEQFLRYHVPLVSDDFCIVGTVSDGKTLIETAVALKLDMPVLCGCQRFKDCGIAMPTSRSS